MPQEIYGVKQDPLLLQVRVGGDLELIGHEVGCQAASKGREAVEELSRQDGLAGIQDDTHATSHGSILLTDVLRVGHEPRLGRAARRPSVPSPKVPDDGGASGQRAEERPLRAKPEGP
eukprot:CAMPEP_0195011788 /NCGR_PEP_ID=MMETSP0326_2-20130528/11277_1 /TAXON_ID=2866 ORGANISM="Crypthecodinium cohnii, Strain Seligo" /NCGR_SAMPLE_ID=MMETSP0326_2 /ASSEMBLY_ACC=CAM_ASM_000348 /LENGTH=117 /DNA_ID=CAMNT_0040021111 /DNA_START=63 /DNA_END=413 /DNA_ORIENTATION=-